MDQETKKFFKEELSGFAVMVNRGFESLRSEMQGEFLAIRDRFDGVDQRFDGVDQRFEKIEEEISELRTELKEEINELRVITKRIDTRTQNQVDAVYDDTTLLKTEVKEMKEDIVSIKAHVGMTA